MIPVGLLLKLGIAAAVFAAGFYTSWQIMDSRVQTAKQELYNERAAREQRDATLKLMTEANGSLRRSLDEQSRNVAQLAREAMGREETALAALSLAQKGTKAAQQAAVTLQSKVPVDADCSKVVNEIKAGL